MACLRLFTFLPDRPERSFPRFRSCIARSTFLLAFFAYFLWPDFRFAMSGHRSLPGDEPYDQEQNDSTDERDENTSEVEPGDPHMPEAVEDPTTQKGTNDTDDKVS